MFHPCAYACVWASLHMYVETTDWPRVSSLIALQAGLELTVEPRLVLSLILLPHAYLILGLGVMKL